MPGVKGQRSGGHNKKTAEEHLAQGTTQRCRESSYAATVPAEGKLIKPTSLDEYGEELWAFVERLPSGSAGLVDSVPLQEMCRWYSLYRRLESAWSDDPLDKEARLGCSAAFDRFKKILDCYPFDMQSRSRLNVPQEEPKKSDPFEDYMKRKEAS